MSFGLSSEGLPEPKLGVQPLICGIIGGVLTDRSKGDIRNLGFFYSGAVFPKDFITREVPHSLLARTVYE